VRTRIVHDDVCRMADRSDAQADVAGGLGDEPREMAVVESEVDEARARDVRWGGDAADVEGRRQGLGDVTRLPTQPFREPHRDVRLEVAEAGVLGRSDEW